MHETTLVERAPDGTITDQLDDAMPVLRYTASGAFPRSSKQRVTQMGRVDRQGYMPR
jgi:hypothetical protein